MKRESSVIPLDMGQETKAGCGGRGSNSGQDGKGCGGRNSTMSRSVPSTVSEVGACKDLEGKMFTIGSGNKGMDKEMLRTSVEKMALYIYVLSLVPKLPKSEQAASKLFSKSQPIRR